MEIKFARFHFPEMQGISPKVEGKAKSHRQITHWVTKLLKCSMVGPEDDL